MFHRSLIGFACLFAAAVFTTGSSSSRNNHKYLVKIDKAAFDANLSEIRAYHIDIAGVDLKKHLVYVVADQSELATLDKIGISFDRIMRDVSIRGPDPKFKTPDQVEVILKKFAADYPDLAAFSVIGKSLEGRDIGALKITQHVSQSSSRPAVLFNGMHHAREVMSVEVPLDIAAYLLQNYGKDQKVTQWLNTIQVYVVPMLNVDGSNIVWTSENMWRKNARGGYGVDIERNYPYAWNSCDGSSDSQNADDYRGPSPASEPETNVLMNFVTQVKPVFDLSFHTFSELVIYPYGCGTHTAPDSKVEPIGRKMASLIKSDDGTGTYTAGLAPDLLYSVDGDDLDWMYHERGVIPYVIELNSGDQGFQPDFDQWRESTVTRLRPAWQYLMDLTEGATVGGVFDRNRLNP